MEQKEKQKREQIEIANKKGYNEKHIVYDLLIRHFFQKYIISPENY